MATETPSHTAISQAAQITGKSTLVDLLAEPGSYVVAPITLPGLSGVSLFRIIPMAVSIPMDFVGAQLGESFIFTTGYASGVGKVLMDKAARIEGDLSRLVYELYRTRSLPLTYVAAASDLPESEQARFSAPQSNQSAGEIYGSFQVVDEGRVQQWQYTFNATLHSITTQP